MKVVKHTLPIWLLLAAGISDAAPVAAAPLSSEPDKKLIVDAGDIAESKAFDKDSVQQRALYANRTWRNAMASSGQPIISGVNGRSANGQIAAAASDTTPVADTVESTSPILETPESLTPAALQLADQLGIGSCIQRLESLRKSNGGASNSLEVVQTKQAVMQGVLVAILQVRATSAQIAHDIFEASQIQNYLEGRRDRTIKLNSLANLVSGGVSELAGGAMQLSPSFKLQNAGNIIEMIGGGVQSALSALALRQQEGGKMARPTKPNMLAPIFDQSTNKDAKYPIVIWKFLNTAPPDGVDTRRALLVKQWLEYGRLPDRDQKHLSALAGLGGNGHPVTIELLEDRQAMLLDLNAVISGVDKSLLEILLYSDLQSL